VCNACGLRVTNKRKSLLKIDERQRMSAIAVEDALAAAATAVEDAARCVAVTATRAASIGNVDTALTATAGLTTWPMTGNHYAFGPQPDLNSSFSAGISFSADISALPTTMLKSVGSVPTQPPVVAPNASPLLCTVPQSMGSGLTSSPFGIAVAGAMNVHATTNQCSTAANCIMPTPTGCATSMSVSSTSHMLMTSGMPMPPSMAIPMMAPPMLRLPFRMQQPVTMPMVQAMPQRMAPPRVQMMPTTMPLLITPATSAGQHKYFSSTHLPLNLSCPVSA